MADIVFIIVLIGFFALCAGLVAACDRIVRSGDDDEPAGASTQVAP